VEICILKDKLKCAFLSAANLISELDVAMGSSDHSNPNTRKRLMLALLLRREEQALRGKEGNAPPGIVNMDAAATLYARTSTSVYKRICEVVRLPSGEACRKYLL
jgi:hypothetical protein